MQGKQASRVLAGMIVGAAVTWALRPRHTASPQPDTRPPYADDEPPTAATPKPATPRTRARWRRSAGVVITIGLIATAAWAALRIPAPDWVRWTLAGIALTGAVSLLLAALLGPGARRLAGESRPLTPQERRELSANERVEAINAARHTLIQAATGLVVIGGIVFTAQGLWYTAQTLETARQGQVTAEQGQITDRYTKAVEQLGSGKLDVRLGGIYALERLARDSVRDHQTIYDVLVAFVREHSPKPSAEITGGPHTDVQTALTVIGRRNQGLDSSQLELSSIQIPFAQLSKARLEEAYLYRIDLSGAMLSKADLSRANLSKARLMRADLSEASLDEVDLSGAELNKAEMTGVRLNGAVLHGADLTGADLSDADLRSAYLVGANLKGAVLDGADLTGANLGVADLRGATLYNAKGVVEADVRQRALTDKTTDFICERCEEYSRFIDSFR